MSILTPVDTLYDATPGEAIALPAELAATYGAFRLPAHANRPHVMSNFVTTLDGVVALNTPGYMSGGAISGHDEHDRFVMGLLRAVADAVVVGAGTLRSVPEHSWTASYIYPEMAQAYQTLRSSLGKTLPPLNVIVTASGEVDARLPVFQSRAVPVLIVTTNAGLRRIRERDFPEWVQVSSAGEGAVLGARAVLAAVRRTHPCDAVCDTILVEGGPHLMGDFFAEHQLDELFLTLAPQVAGRDELSERPGLVAGKLLAPEHSVWGTLVGVKRGGSHLFLRYTFAVSIEKED